MMTLDEAEERGTWWTIEEEPGRGANKRASLLTTARMTIKMPPDDRDRDGDAGDGDGNGICVCICTMTPLEYLEYYVVA